MRYAILYEIFNGEEVNPMGKLKKVFTVFMAVTVMMAFTVGTGFAATSSNTDGKDPATKGSVTKPVGEYSYSSKAGKKTGTATLKMIKKSKQKTIKKKVIYASIKKNGKKYRVTKVAAGAFKGCKKLNQLQFKSSKWTKSYSFSKKAFKGLKKSQIKKIKVRVNKKMSKKDFKRLKKQLKAAGIPAKNIKKNL